MAQRKPNKGRVAKLKALQQMPIFKFMKKWSKADEKGKSEVIKEARAQWKSDVISKEKRAETQQRMAKIIKLYNKRTDPKRHHQKKFFAGMRKGYPLFSLFDRNKDGMITEGEFIALGGLVGNEKSDYFKFNHLHDWFRQNAKEICHDPRPQPLDSDSDSNSDHEDFDGFMGPLSKFWFQLDIDRNGYIDKDDFE